MQGSFHFDSLWLVYKGRTRHWQDTFPLASSILWQLPVRYFRCQWPWYIVYTRFLGIPQFSHQFSRVPSPQTMPSLVFGLHSLSDSIRWTRNGIDANSISQDRRVERVKGLHCNASSSGSGCFWRLSCNYNAVSASSTIISHCNPKACMLLTNRPGRAKPSCNAQSIQRSIISIARTAPSGHAYYDERNVSHNNLRHESVTPLSRNARYAGGGWSLGVASTPEKGARYCAMLDPWVFECCDQRIASPWLCPTSSAGF